LVTLIKLLITPLYLNKVPQSFIKSSKLDNLDKILSKEAFNKVHSFLSLINVSTVLLFPIINAISPSTVI